MLRKIREKFLEKDIRDLLGAPPSSSRDLALESLKNKAIIMYKNKKISQNFFYNTFFTFKDEQKFWEIHRDKMKEILKK